MLDIIENVDYSKLKSAVIDYTTRLDKGWVSEDEIADYEHHIFEVVMETFYGFPSVWIWYNDKIG